MTSPTLRTSPSTRPSICMSPVEARVPFITISALMIEGADSGRPRLGAGGGATGAGVSGRSLLLLLENMTASLYEVVRVLDGVIVPDFVMDMRTGAASG